MKTVNIGSPAPVSGELIAVSASDITGRVLPAIGERVNLRGDHDEHLAHGRVLRIHSDTGLIQLQVEGSAHPPLTR